MTRAPAEHVARHRAQLGHHARVLRDSSRRQLAGEHAALVRRAAGLARQREGTLRDLRQRRPAELERLAIALSAHDPERTLARGYALVETADGEPLTSAAAAREHEDVGLRFADGRLTAKIASDDRRA
jgi:exodeoxyribonuclease VII large subunit